MRKIISIFIKQLFCRHRFIELIMLSCGRLSVSGKIYDIAPVRVNICPKCQKIKSEVEDCAWTRGLL